MSTEAPIFEVIVDEVTPYHGVDEPAKRNSIAADMRKRGYVGPPIVVYQMGRYHFQALTGVHRLAAARIARLDTVPAVSILDVFKEDGVNVNQIFEEYGDPDPTDPSADDGFGDMIENELSPEIRKKYGLEFR